MNAPRDNDWPSLLARDDVSDDAKVTALVRYVATNGTLPKDCDWLWTEAVTSPDRSDNRDFLLPKLLAKLDTRARARLVRSGPQPQVNQFVMGLIASCIADASLCPILSKVVKSLDEQGVCAAARGLGAYAGLYPPDEPLLGQQLLKILKSLPDHPGRFQARLDAVRAGGPLLPKGGDKIRAWRKFQDSLRSFQALVKQKPGLFSARRASTEREDAARELADSLRKAMPDDWYKDDAHASKKLRLLRGLVAQASIPPDALPDDFDEKTASYLRSGTWTVPPKTEQSKSKTAQRAKPSPEGSKALEVDAVEVDADSARSREAVESLKRAEAKGVDSEVEVPESRPRAQESTGQSREGRPRLLARPAIWGAVTICLACLMLVLVSVIVLTRSAPRDEFQIHVAKLRQLLDYHKLEEAGKHIDELKQNEPDVYGHPAVQKVKDELEVAIREDEGHRASFERILADARDNGKTLDGYVKALKSLEDAEELAADDSEKKKVGEVRVWVEDNHQKIREKCDQGFGDRLIVFRDESDDVGWSDLKKLERLIKDGEDLIDTPYVSSEHKENAKSLVRRLTEWLALAKEQPRLRPQYNVDLPPPIPPGTELVAEPSAQELPAIPGEPPADGLIEFQLWDKLAAGEYAIYIRGLELVSDFATCHRHEDGVTIAVQNGRHECCRFFFSDPRLSNPSKLCCQIAHPDNEAVVQIQRKLWLCVVELRGPNNSLSLISLRRLCPYSIAAIPSQTELTLSDLPKEIQTEDLYLGDGQLWYGDRRYTFGSQWRQLKPSKQWTLDQLASDLGLSIAEFRLLSTQTEGLKIVTRFEADESKLFELQREIQRRKKELESLRTLTEKAPKNKGEPWEFVELAIALEQKAIEDRRPTRTTSDYDDRKFFDSRSKAMRGWSPQQKQEQLRKDREHDWDEYLGPQVRKLLAESLKRQSDLGRELEQKEKARVRMTNVASEARHWTKMRVDIYRAVQARDRQIRVPLAEVAASRTER